jgi:hypothetical protein
MQSEVPQCKLVTIIARAGQVNLREMFSVARAATQVQTLDSSHISLRPHTQCHTRQATHTHTHTRAQEDTSEECAKLAGVRDRVTALPSWGCTHMSDTARAAASSDAHWTRACRFACSNNTRCTPPKGAKRATTSCSVASGGRLRMWSTLPGSAIVCTSAPTCMSDTGRCRAHDGERGDVIASTLSSQGINDDSRSCLSSLYRVEVAHNPAHLPAFPTAMHSQPIVRV